MFTHYVIADTPTIGNPTPLKRAGVIDDINNALIEAGETILAVDLTGTYGRLGTWQGQKQFRWYCGANWCLDNSELHRPIYEMHFDGTDYTVVQTEAPFISQTYARGTVSASLTIS